MLGYVVPSVDIGSEPKYQPLCVSIGADDIREKTDKSFAKMKAKSCCNEKKEILNM